VWTGGGTVFGPTPRHYTVKVNRKARRGALRSVLSLHAERESLAVFDATSFEEPSTSRAAEVLSDWGAPSPTLILLTDDEASAGKSFRNLPHAEAMPVQDAGVADIVGAASLLVSEAALQSLLARAGSAESAESADADSVAESAAADSAGPGSPDEDAESAGAESPGSDEEGEEA
jgi:large subunit ribosomal protein L4